MPSPLSIRKLRAISSGGPAGLLVESTAPLNVEDGIVIPADTDFVDTNQGTNTENLTEACGRLAAQAEKGADLSVIIQIHGFNNPAKVAYVRYGQAWNHYRKNSGENVLYVGYRWPGEGMGSTLKSSITALPTAAFYLLGASVLLLLTGMALTVGNTNGGASVAETHLVFWGMALLAIVGSLAALTRIINTTNRNRSETEEKGSFSGPLTLLFGCLLLAIWLRFNYDEHPFRWAEFFGNPLTALNALPNGIATISPILIGGLLAALPLVVVIFRILVYFRDAFRAEHFGVPDLVEFIRHLDLELDKQLAKYPRRRVSLSFIGHSMGALVAAGTVRILTDVFDQNSMADLDSAEHAESPKPEIGRRLRLGNLVLVSPDIPAEALLSGRSNFLASSIRRFREAHLFSNEADVVLRCISAIANAFSFPSSTRKHGQRLGNTHVTWQKGQPKPPFGIVNPIANGMPQIVPTAEFLKLLFVGRFPVPEIQQSLRQQKYGESLANCVTYFDCTDYRDTTEGSGQMIPALSYARKMRFIGRADMGLLLVNYLRIGWLFPGWRKDVHSAYFDFPMVRTLIYSTAEGGAQYAIASLSPAGEDFPKQVDTFHQATSDRGLQVLFSESSLSNLSMSGGQVALPAEWERQLQVLVTAALKSLNTVEPSGLTFETAETRLKVLLDGNPQIQEALFELLTIRAAENATALKLLQHLEAAVNAEIVFGELRILVERRLIRCSLDCRTS